MTNIFLVQTPFQVFNAIEAKQRFHKDEYNILIIIDKGNTKNKYQIDFILEKNYNWDKVITIPFYTRTHKLFYPLIYKKKINQLKKIKNINNIYVALYRNISAHIINSLNYKNITLFDDGNNIFKTIKFLNEKRQKKLQYLTSLFTYYKNNINFIYEADIFTIFNLSNYSLTKNKVITNNYTYFKSTFNTFKKVQNMYFIGSKVIDNGLTKESFENTLKQIVHETKIQNQQLIYIPHRYEDIEYLNKLSKKMDFKLKILDTIIEYNFIMEKTFPENISTIRSTAVDSLTTLFGDINVTIFKINQTILNENKKEEFELVYENFNNKGYTIKELYK